ncbi:MAG TPA: type III-B CRISPR module-associated protein Cmr3 [Saprospiraceae bacterium]|nr:type III-B CRISPR module-associated protein Cmr3 [Saprospiraceae bacterium]HMP26227.1 type III-B CRISPR module-associated protein Cmr3 [Saprospiraceae bacterium]
MYSLQINAADTLFFRDGRPFNMGEDTYAQGIFPPPPSVLYGALRTAYMAADTTGQPLSALITATGALTIHNLFLKSDKDILYAPLPADLFVDKDGNITFPELKKEKEVPVSSIPTPQMLYHNTNGKPDGQPRLVTLEILKDYLDNGNQQPTFKNVPLKDFTEKETKLGIARSNATRTSDEGMLYRMEMVRLEKQQEDKTWQSLSFWVQYDGIILPTETWVRIGGDKKATYINSCQLSIENLLPRPTLQSNQFKIYLATPALFEAGWYPENLLAKHDLELIAAAVGKPLHLGGFDMVKRGPKPMLKAVPAGSVYYVQLKSDSKKDINAIAQDIHGKTISEFDSKYSFKGIPENKLPDSARQGFGAAFIGNI